MSNSLLPYPVTVLQLQTVLNLQNLHPFSCGPALYYRMDAQAVTQTLYFAFGSNLSTAQMHRRCPASTALGLGELKGWRWIINKRGYANVVPGSTSTVYGLLYRLPSDDEATLDLCEGVPWAYDKKYLDAKWLKDRAGTEMGKTVRVLVYVDEARIDDGVPKEEYVHRMAAGINEMQTVWGMDSAYADGLRAWLKK